MQTVYRAVYLPGDDGWLHEAAPEPCLWFDGKAYDVGPFLMFWNGVIGEA